MYRKSRRPARWDFSGRWSRAIACGVCSALLACTVDERRLAHDHFEWISAGGAGGSDEVGDLAGAGGMHHWTFDVDSDGWVTEPGVQQSWQRRDARNSPRSGALLVSSTLIGDSSDYWTGASTQCVPVTEGENYGLDLDIFIPLQDTTGGAGAAILYTNADACEGLMLNLTTLTSSALGTWKHGRAALAAPAGTKSALLRLLVTKISDGPSYQASFDNVEFGPD